MGVLATSTVIFIIVSSIVLAYYVAKDFSWEKSFGDVWVAFSIVIGLASFVVFGIIYSVCFTLKSMG